MFACKIMFNLTTYYLTIKRRNSWIGMLNYRKFHENSFYKVPWSLDIYLKHRIFSLTNRCIRILSVFFSLRLIIMVYCKETLT